MKSLMRRVQLEECWLIVCDLMKEGSSMMRHQPLHTARKRKRDSAGRWRRISRYKSEGMSDIIGAGGGINVDDDRRKLLARG